MPDGIELEQTCGACPEQYQGTVDGNPAYFRLRHSYWQFCIVKPGECPSGPQNQDNVLYFKTGEYMPGQNCGVMEDALGLIHSMIAEFRDSARAKATLEICLRCGREINVEKYGLHDGQTCRSLASTLAEDIYALRMANAALKAEIERLKRVPCRHDEEAQDRARRDSGYF